MSLETAAAILTKLAIEQNNDFKAKLGSAAADKSALVPLIMPLFRQILSELQDERQAHDAFPSAIPE